MKRIDFLLILALGIVFGLGGGVPYFHPDFLLDEVVSVLQNKGDPEFFWYPALYIYLLSAAYGLLLMVGRTVGWCDSVDGLMMFLRDRGLLFFPGQLVTLSFSVAGAWGAAWLTWRLVRHRGFALLAACSLLVSLLWTRNTHYLTPDVPLATLCLWTCLLVLKAGEPRSVFRIRDVVWIGLLFGAAVAVKYNSVLLAPPLAVALWLYYPDKKKWLLHGLLAAVVSALFFAATNPYLFVHFQTFYEQFVYNVAEMTGGKIGFEAQNGWWYHLAYSSYYGFGALPLLLAATGTLWLFRNTSLKAADRVALVAFPLFFYAVMGHEKVAYTRHILPVWPFLAVLSALGAWHVAQTLGRRLPGSVWPRLVLAVLLAAAIGPQTLASLRHNRLLRAGDTRDQLVRLLQRHGGGPSMVAYTGHYTKQLVRRASFDVAAQLISSPRFNRERDPVRRIFRTRVPLVALDSFSHDRLLAASPADLPVPPGGFEDLHVLQINPFRLPKEEVPLTSESIYSPFPRDMDFRTLSGPFIELYCRGEDLARELEAAGKQAGVSCTRLAGTNGYYFTRVGGRISLY